MRIFIFCLFLLSGLFQLHAQILLQGVVKDQKTGERLAFVNIYTDKTQNGTTTDIDGKFSLKANHGETMHFSYVGYESYSFRIEGKMPNPLVVELKASSYELKEVVLVENENPAHRIIRKTVENKALHEPKNYRSFSYYSYNKFIFTLNTDSLTVPDTLVTAQDSSLAEIAEFSETKHLFVMESVSRRRYLQGQRDNEEVLATRVSGLKDPTFALLAGQFQSFSFYDDYITVMYTKYLNPLSKNSEKRYVFILEDTTYFAKDTVYIISFRPSISANFQGLKGVLYINSSSYALQNVIAEPVEAEGLIVKIQQKYERFERDYWFPVQLNTDMTFLNASVNGAAVQGIGRSYLDSIQVNPDLNKREIDRTEISLIRNASKQEEDFWNQYRRDELDEKERETYVYIDSIGKEMNLDMKLKFAQTLLTGKLRTGFVDWDLDRLLMANNYESVRLGLGAHTNERFMKRVFVGGYFGYGFQDKEWKYGADIQWLAIKQSDFRVGLQYSSDIPEAGGLQYRSETWVNPSNSYRQFFVSDRDRAEIFQAFVQFRPRPTLKTRFFLETTDRLRMNDYYFDLNTAESDQQNFRYTEAGLSLQWAPKDKYMQTAEGLMNVSRAYPLVLFQVGQGIAGILGGDFNYTKANLQVEHAWRIRNFGRVYVTAMAGAVEGNVPYSMLNNAPGNRINIVLDHFSFETVQNNLFTHSAYGYLMLRHNLGSPFKQTKSFKPNFQYTLKAGWGTLTHPENHQNTSTSTMAKGYYEGGIIIGRIFGNYGIGAFYTLGSYAHSRWQENLAVRLFMDLPFGKR
jgi:hypothetical protein